MTYQEQYQSSLNEINEAMKKCLKEKPPCTETVQGKEMEENQMNKRETLEFLEEIGVIKVIPEEEKEPVLQEAKTSSQKNNSIDNDNTQKEECQEEIDYQNKYIKCSNLLCLTELRIKKIYQLLNNVWEDFASVDIDQSQFIGAACLKEMPLKQKNKRLLYGCCQSMTDYLTS